MSPFDERNQVLRSVYAVTAADQATERLYACALSVLLGTREAGNDPAPHGEHMTTYGTDPAHCDAIAGIAKFLQAKILGWLQETADPEPALARITPSPDGKAVRVTVEDLLGQTLGERVVQDDYALVTTGKVFVKSIQVRGKTHMLAVGP